MKQNHFPPKLAKRLLHSFLRFDIAEEVSGDLDEKFYATLRRTSSFRARLNYWYQVLHYLRPFALKKRKSSPANHITMFQNYFKIGFRNLLRNKGYSFINISGLATGMAVAMVIGLWIHDELTFDRYHQNNATIAQVFRRGTINGETMATEYLPYALGDELKTKYSSSFKHVLMASTLHDWILSEGAMNMTRKGEFIDPGAPEMLSLKMVKGNWDGLKDQHSILLSASVAKIFFGESDPVGKAMRIGNRMDVTVTGVYEDLPHNTHFYGVDFFAPWDLYLTVNQWMTTQGFTNNFLNIYTEIQPSTDFDRASEHIRKAIVNNVQDKKEYVAVNPEIFLHPMSKWHLWSDWENGSFSTGLIQFVWLFGIVGVFVLLLACINFMNLSTARSERRAKEVGIRKAIGSVRRQLVNQFFSESFLVVFIAFAFAILLVTLSLGLFNALAGKQMTMLWSNRWFWLISLGFILFTGFVAGSYPALYLSSFQPVKVLKGAFRAGKFATIPRKVLVVVQFTVSVTLAIGTMIVYQQVQYAKNRPIGYDRNGLLMVLMNAPEYGPALEPLQNELLNTGVVDELALSMSPTTGIWSSNGGFEWRGKPEGFQMDFGTLDVTHNYGKTVGWEFIEGRDFSRDLASDSTAFVINEAAAKLMGLENPVGELVKWEPGWMVGKTYTIIGVIKDMVMRSPFTLSMPTVFFISNRMNWINIRLRPDVSSAEAVQKIEAVFRKNVPTVPFNFQFADQEYAIKFAAEERIEKLAAVFAFLAILISCLGLFGLASFMAEQRTKEIGIRKVVGASVFNLWRMLSKDFVILVIISCFLAIPLGWYFLSRWLENYEYRTNISWEVFALAVTGAIAITLLTVSYQAVRVARMNPVNSLRSE